MSSVSGSSPINQLLTDDDYMDKLRFNMDSYIIEIKVAKKSFKDVIIPIINRASVEMCKYVDDQSMICAYLCQIFPKDISRDVRRYIDPKFKHDYVKEALEELPKDIIQELFTLIIDNENDILDGATALLKFYNEQDQTEREILMAGAIKVFGNLPKLKEFLEKLKETRIESKVLRNKTDKRIQIDILSKILLKIQTFYLSKNFVHNLNAVSTKWLKTGIQQRGSLEEIAQKIFKADARLMQISEWFDVQLARIETSNDPKFDPIPDFKAVLANKNKELEKEIAELRKN